ncbi:MAG TPA: methyltransferase [Candidatus Hydrogenedentes bacterium]|nr:methyltransferase [Candidatus Hydrogenedentota bacterium]
MAYSLMGIESNLANKGCERVELLHQANGRRSAFVRQDEETWHVQDSESVSLHTAELQERLVANFGLNYDRLVCRFSDHEVMYTLNQGEVNMTHKPLSQEAKSGAARREWKALTDALGIPRSKRRHKLKQAEQFAHIVKEGLDKADNREVRVLDVACGRSYLGFVLCHVLFASGFRPWMHGVDADPVLVDKCHDIAGALGWRDCVFEVANLEHYAAEPGRYDVLVSLHGCDALSDEAIRIGVDAKIPLLFVAPCCQQELRRTWGPHPLQWIRYYPVLEERLADILTDGFRSLVLEAMGYRVTALRFVAPDVTPKNLLIQAKMVSRPCRDRAAEAKEFQRLFSVQPRLSSLLDRIG